MTFQDRLDEYMATLRYEIESGVIASLNEQPKTSICFTAVVSSAIDRINKSDKHGMMKCLFCGSGSSFARCFECSDLPTCMDCGCVVSNNTKLRCSSCACEVVSKTHGELVYLNDQGQALTRDGTILGNAIDPSKEGTVKVNLDLSKLSLNERSYKSNMLGCFPPPDGVFVDELGNTSVFDYKTKDTRDPKLTEKVPNNFPDAALDDSQQSVKSDIIEIGDVFQDEKFFKPYPRKIYAEFLPPEPSDHVPEIKLDEQIHGSFKHSDGILRCVPEEKRESSIKPEGCDCGAEAGHVPGGIHCRGVL